MFGFTWGSSEPNPPRMEEKSKLADLKLVSKHFPVSNFSYPRPDTPAQTRPATRDRSSIRSDVSVPGMVDDDHESDASAEDEHYHTSGAELWDSFWQTDARRSCPRKKSSLLFNNNSNNSNNSNNNNNNPESSSLRHTSQTWVRDDELYPARSHHRSPGGSDPTGHSHSYSKDAYTWPLPTRSQQQLSRSHGPKTPVKTTYSLFPQQTSTDSMRQAVPPRTTSLQYPTPAEQPLSPTAVPLSFKVPPRGHKSRPSLVTTTTSVSGSASVSNASTRTSAATTPATTPLSSTSSSPAPLYPSPATENGGLPATAPRSLPKRRTSLANLRKLSLSKTPPVVTPTTNATPSPHYEAVPLKPWREFALPDFATITQPEPLACQSQSQLRPQLPAPTASLSPSLLPPLPSPTHSIKPPSRQSPQVHPSPPAQPLVSVFEFDSDDEDGPSNSDERESSRSLARRIVRGLAGHHGHGHSNSTQGENDKTHGHHRRQSRDGKKSNENNGTITNKTENGNRNGDEDKVRSGQPDRAPQAQTHRRHRFRSLSESRRSAKGTEFSKEQRTRTRAGTVGWSGYTSIFNTRDEKPMAEPPLRKSEGDAGRSEARPGPAPVPAPVPVSAPAPKSEEGDKDLPKPKLRRQKSDVFVRMLGMKSR